MIRFESVKSPTSYILCFLPFLIHGLASWKGNYYEAQELGKGRWFYRKADIQKFFKYWSTKEIADFLKEDTEIRKIINKKFNNG